eukprot:4365619-Pyramimonas_sp.AAC.1
MGWWGYAKRKEFRRLEHQKPRMPSSWLLRTDTPTLVYASSRSPTLHRGELTLMRSPNTEFRGHTKLP